MSFGLTFLTRVPIIRKKGEYHKTSLLSNLCDNMFSLFLAQGTEWVSLDKNQVVETFYNRESVAELPSGVIRVWVKWELSDAGRINVANFWDVLPGACDQVALIC